MTSVEDEPISTLSHPLPIPPYEFDTNFSEDENFLTWVSILARHSSSKKGHMGTIFVRPPTQGDPANVNQCAECSPPVKERIVHYANNTPLLYARFAKGVPEVHAEALAISRCARFGIPLEGCTVYISFPPCNDCMKLLLSAGIKRCVFKKQILANSSQGEASLVAAEVEGMELVGTLQSNIQDKVGGGQDAVKQAKMAEREEDERRDQRVRAFWLKMGEDAQRTRDRVARWWENYMLRYKAADKVVKGKYGTADVEQQEKKRLADKERKRKAKLEELQNKQGSGKKKAAKQARLAKEQNGPFPIVDVEDSAPSEIGSNEESDLDELMNGHGGSGGTD